jgi:GNAT superfamily N-acetyltransferase
MSVKSSIHITHLLPVLEYGDDGPIPPAKEAEPLATALAKDTNTQKLLQAYVSLRLMSLRQNPEAFSSNYAREAAFTDEQWEERLWGGQRDKATFIASMARRTPKPEQHPDPTNDKGWSENTTGATRPGPEEGPQEWIGCVTILGPGAIKSISGDLYLSLSNETGISAEEASHYLVGGMWVNASYRGQGVGKMLVRAILDWAKQHEGDRDKGRREFEYDEGQRDVATSCHSSSLVGEVHSAKHGRAKVIVLQVRATNVSAKSLYQTLGFGVLRKPEGTTETPPDSDIWMAHYC